MSKPRGTPRQIAIASAAAAGYLAFSVASGSEGVLEKVPEGSSLRRALERYRDACRRSPRLSVFRSLSSAMVMLWAHSVRIHNVSIVDIMWGLTFAINSATYSCHQEAEKAFAGRKVLVTAMTTAWAARLSTFLWWRNHVSAHGIGAGASDEDFRYQVFRKFWDKKGLSYWWFSLLQVFGLQAGLSFLVSAPLGAAATREQPQHFTAWDAAGAAAFGVGYVFEHAADLEMTAFKSNPANKGQIILRGFWAYTRHPNYFGNALMWWGIYLVACATQGGWKSIYGPMVMNYLLTNVSGAKLLEKTLRRTKPGFAQYVDTVPEFIPWGLISLK